MRYWCSSEQWEDTAVAHFTIKLKVYLGIFRVKLEGISELTAAEAECSSVEMKPCRCWSSTAVSTFFENDFGQV